LRERTARIPHQSDGCAFLYAAKFFAIEVDEPHKI